MNIDKSSQSTPDMPDHYEVLTHPLVHFRNPPCFTDCLDILHNCCHLIDLFGAVDIDGESTGDGLSEQAANAFFWQTRMLESTLRYVGLSLKDVDNRQAEHLDRVTSSAFFRALKVAGEGGGETGYKMLAEGLGVEAGDVVGFVELLKKGTFSDPS